MKIINKQKASTLSTKDFISLALRIDVNGRERLIEISELNNGDTVIKVGEYSDNGNGGSIGNKVYSFKEDQTGNISLERCSWYEWHEDNNTED